MKTRLLILALGAITVAALCDLTTAGQFFRQRSVGGISVNAEGVVVNATTDELGQLRKLRQESLGEVSKDLAGKTELRKISLKRLQAAIQKHLDEGTDLSKDIQFLGGLQRIRYVFVYPEQNDIVIAGPAEGWKVDAQGNVVGKTTGLPVLQLEDLVVALHAATRAAGQSITCSIDPTAEGMAKLQDYVKQQGGQIGGNPQQTLRSLEEVLGMHKITFSGVNPTTRFAHVLIAADYRMKRLGMGLEQSPISGLPSYLAMARGASNMFPRWWLTTHYDPLLKSKDGTAWELRGQGVKAMTEDAFFEANGQRRTTGQTSAVAQKWADNMTDKFDALAAKTPVFTELRNMMDLAVVSTLIKRQQLDQKAGCDLSVLLSPAIEVSEMPVPKELPSKASVNKKGRSYIIGVSGGIEIQPLKVIQSTETSDQVSEVKSAAAADATVWQWYWN